MTPAIAAAGFGAGGAVSLGRSGDAASGWGSGIEAARGLEGSAGGGDGNGGSADSTGAPNSI